MTLGEKLRQRRLELGLSQNDVAQDRITRNMLSQLEHDQASPSVKTLLYLADILQVSVGWLLEEHGVHSGDPSVDAARTAFVKKDYAQCMALLANLDRHSQEGGLLLHRSAVQVARDHLQHGRTEDARKALSVAGTAESVYLCACDLQARLLTNLECALADHADLDAAAQAVSVLACSGSGQQDQTALLAEYSLKKGQLPEAEAYLQDLPPEDERFVFLKGLLLFRKGCPKEGAECLEQAELSGKLCRRHCAMLYRHLEQYYAARENYQLAYRYASLRMER